MRTLPLSALLASLVLAPALVQAQTVHPGEARYGVWRMQSDAPAPASNVMTYAPWGDGGMRITVESTNGEGRSSAWEYVTLFDGRFRPVDGQEEAETAVAVVDDRTTRILNRRSGRLTTIILNTLSENGDTIRNEYIRMGDDGPVAVSHAVYVRIR
jgi:hypothetical protein